MMMTLLIILAEKGITTFLAILSNVDTLVSWNDFCEPYDSVNIFLILLFSLFSQL